MTPDQATGPLILEWSSWHRALEEAASDYRSIHRGAGTTKSAESDLGYLMSAIQERMDEIRTQIDEVTIDTALGGPGSVALMEWLRCFKPQKVAASTRAHPVLSFAAAASRERSRAVVQCSAEVVTPPRADTGQGQLFLVPRADAAISCSPGRSAVLGEQVAKGFFDEWRLANRLASATEQIVFLASLDAIEGRGPPPTSQDLANAKRLRQLANDLLAIGMKAMDERVAQLRRPW